MGATSSSSSPRPKEGSEKEGSEKLGALAAAFLGTAFVTLIESLWRDRGTVASVRVSTFSLWRWVGDSRGKGRSDRLNVKTRSRGLISMSINSLLVLVEEIKEASPDADRGRPAAGVAGGDGGGHTG